MTSRRDDDLDLIDEEATREVVQMLRAAFTSDRLPRVGSELASVFAHGLPETAPAEVPSPPASPVPPRRSLLRRRLATRASYVAVGAAAVTVNLAGVGSAGWLPGPLQSGFERVTESVGLEIPRPSEPGPDRVPAGGDGPGPSADQPGGGRPGRGPAGRDPAGGPADGPSSRTGPSKAEPQKKDEDKKRGGDQQTPPGKSPTTPDSPPRGERGRGADPGGGPPPTVCTPASAPGPTLPPVPPVPTTLRVPVPGDPAGGVPRPPVGVSPGPPGCPPP